MAMKRYTTISLYTGAGGLDLGFEAAGFDTRVAVELDPDAADTLRANRDWRVINADIHSPSATSSEILKSAGLGIGEADMLIGGPPCQPFSKSGYWASGDSKRLSDPRATTLDAYLRVLRDVQPRAYLIENVPGLAYSDKNEGLQFLRKSIESINRSVGTHYSFSVKLLRAVDFGVPQERERVFIVGSRDGKEFKFMEPAYFDKGKQPTSRANRIRTAWDALHDIASSDEELAETKLKGKWADLLPSIPEGNNYLFHTDRGGGVPLFGWRRRYWSFLLKLAKNRPSWTLTAQPGPAIGPFHWRNRRLTRTEMLAIQTFPRDYKVLGGYRAATMQVGNAVPSALAETIAREIREQFFGDNSIGAQPMQLVPPATVSTPAPEPVSKVLDKFMHLRGEHEAHPGTGLGYGASRRRA